MSRFLRMSYVVGSVAGVAFFVLSVVLLGVWPARVLEEQTRKMSPDHPLGLTASEQRGRIVYSREGCAYCHTQQIRYLHADILFLGVDGFDVHYGLSTPNLLEAKVNRVMMEVARITVAVCDSSKFRRRSLSSIAPPSALHHLITDRGIPKSDLATLKKIGTQVTLV